MGLMSVTEIANYLKSAGQKLEPLNFSDIQRIEQLYNVLLPDVYKEFLSLMGKGAGDYMKGSSVFYDEIFLLKEYCQELFEEHNIEMANDGFVFWMHQGYQVAFFKLSEGSDPPVYFFSEGNNSKPYILKEESLTAFFNAQLLMSFPEISVS
jgi:hypothetical protein